VGKKVGEAVRRVKHVSEVVFGSVYGEQCRQLLRGIPRLRTFIGTMRLLVRRSILASGRKSSGRFSRRVGALDMAVIAGTQKVELARKILVLRREKQS
jgi:hypothetical protein